MSNFKNYMGEESVPLVGYSLGAALDVQTFGPMKATSAGALIVTAVASGGVAIDVTDLTGPIPTGETAEIAASVNYLFDGTQFDRARNNTQETVLASAARTASVDSTDFTNHNAKGLHIIVNVSAITATPSIIAAIQGKDPVSGNYYDLLVGTAITTTGINVLKIYPGIGQIANGAASDLLPRIWRVSIAHADVDSITYSVGANLVL